MSEQVKLLITQAQGKSREGRHQEALSYFQEAFSLDPLHPTLLASIAFELRELGRVDEAILALEKLLVRLPNSIHALSGLAQIARMQGRKVEAINFFEKLLALEPKHPTYPVAIAAELRGLGRHQESLAMLDKFLWVTLLYLVLVHTLRVFCFSILVFQFGQLFQPLLW